MCNCLQSVRISWNILIIYLPITRDIFSGRDPYMIDADACVHSPHDLKQLQTPEMYCFATFNILTSHYYEL